MTFKELIGKTITIATLENGELAFTHPTLRGVESGGIWVSSDELTNQLLRGLGAQAAEKSPVVFLPYHSFLMAVAAEDKVALDEKSFG